MTPENSIGTFVVIVNWQRPQETIECIQSVLNGNLPPGRVLVVDNGSQDDSIAQIKRAFPEVQVFPLPENLGFAGGFNHGIQIALDAGANAVLILNNDTVVDDHTIDGLMDSDWDVAVPKIYYQSDPKRIWSAGATWRRFPPMVVIRGYRESDSPKYDRIIPLEYATACALLVRRRVFEQVGMFDPRFENYYEDYDFCYRVRASGFRMGYVPKARVWHKVSRSLGLTSSRFWWYLGRNAVLFYRKDNRFSVWVLGIYLFWVTLRESVKLNLGCLMKFWSGVSVGWKSVKYGNSDL